MINKAVAGAVDVGFRMMLAKKYNLVGKDESGRGIYEVPCDRWEEGDLECVVAWNQWLGREVKTEDELATWVNIALARGVDSAAVQDAVPKKPMSLPFKIGLGAAVVFGVKWLFTPPKILTQPIGEPVTSEHINDLVETAFPKP